jgi:hypothetical protein
LEMQNDPVKVNIFLTAYITALLNRRKTDFTRI